MYSLILIQQKVESTVKELFSVMNTVERILLDTEVKLRELAEIFGELKDVFESNKYKKE